MSNNSYVMIQVVYNSNVMMYKYYYDITVWKLCNDKLSHHGESHRETAVQLYAESSATERLAWRHTQSTQYPHTGTQTQHTHTNTNSHTHKFKHWYTLHTYIDIRALIGTHTFSIIAWNTRKFVCTFDTCTIIAQ